MQKFQNKLISLFLASFLGLSTAMLPSLASAYDRETRVSTDAMVMDALAVRPLMLAATAVGTVVFIVSLPFTAFGNNADKAVEQLVLEPAKYTFVRPLGHMEAEPLNNQ
jgi:hypothetical protein